MAIVLLTSAAWAGEGHDRDCRETKVINVDKSTHTTVVNQAPKVHQLESGVGVTPIWWESKNKVVSVSTPYTAVINKGERVQHQILGVVTVNVWSIFKGNK